MQSPYRTLALENRGRTEIRCPIGGCLHTKSFIETAQTLRTKADTRRRRDEYLRQVHATGGHGVPDSPYV